MLETCIMVWSCLPYWYEVPDSWAISEQQLVLCVSPIETVNTHNKIIEDQNSYKFFLTL